MTLSAPSRARRLQRLLAVLVAATLLLGLVPPAAVGADNSGNNNQYQNGNNADGTKLEPRLWRTMLAQPTTKFRVIVTRQPARDKKERQHRQSQVENDMQADGGKVGI